MPYFPREMEKTLREAAGQFRVLVVTGARQTGKSTLLRRLFSKTHRYVTLDNPSDLRLAEQDPELFFSDYAGPLILDEIQYAPGLLSYVKMAADASRRPGQILLTGSQQFTLMKNLRESLAGRAALFDLYPMSVREGPVARRDYVARALRGSYPEPQVHAGLDARRWYASYVSTYLEKDVQTHYRLERITHFRDLLYLLAARTSQVLNMQSLANDLGVAVPSIKSWIRILEASQIIHLLRPYHVNLGTRLVKAPKVYFMDIGLVCFLVGITQKEAVLKGPMAGPLFENFVVQEVLKHYANRGETAPVFYYRDNHQVEVDLLIEPRFGELMPCEIKLNKTPHPGMAGSIERLRRLNKSTRKIGPGFIVTPMTGSRPLTRNDRAISLEKLLQIL